jgi:hypothetical protein
VSDDRRDLGEAFGALLQLVFSLTFPLLLITLCGVSFVLASVFDAPEFSLWAGLATVAFDYAKTNIWVAVGLAVFCLAALPLAWVAFREQQLRTSTTILAWVVAVIAFGFMFWLRTAWPSGQNGWQLIVYGIILFAGWSAAIEAVLGTLGIMAHVRRNRPVPVKPPRQEPHGKRERRKPGNDPETI